MTLKNFGMACIGLAVLFIALSFDWHRPRGGVYGRLFGTQVGATDTATRTPEVVREAPVADQSGVDPLLVAPAAREQAVGVNVQLNPQTDTMATAAATTFVPDVPQVRLSSTAAKGSGVVIVGDEHGVAVAKTPQPARPVLSGGIFRQ